MSMKAFIAVSHTGSFARAADSLGLSRAMVTKHIRQLEDSLGVRLLNRTTRKLSLTEVGAAYRERCSQILADVDEADSAATQLSSQPTGMLRIAAPPSFGAFHLVPAIGDYIDVYPKVQVSLTLTDRLPDLAEDGHDVSIHLGELQDSSLVAQRVAHARMVVCGAPTYFARHGVPRHPDELARHQCLRYSTHAAHHDQWAFVGQEQCNVKVGGPLIANTGDALRVGALEGLGIVLLPTYMVGDDLRAGRLVAVLSEFEPAGIDINAVYLHRKHLSAKVRTFVGFLKARFLTRPFWDDWRAGEPCSETEALA